MLGDADVPDDGERYAVVGWKQWSNLLGIEEFADANYIEDGDLPWKGTQAKRWLGTLWMPHSGLTKTSSVRLVSQNSYWPRRWLRREDRHHMARRSRSKLH
jgi:hypothetical protein